MNRMFYLISQLTLCTLLLTGSLQATPEATPAGEETRQEAYSLGKGHLAIDGYDPVSYFQSDKPLKGRKDIATVYRGVTYRFASKANQQTFLANPAQYEPAYGGWCAWAMLDADKTKPNPKSFKIVNGKLYLFYDGLWGDTLKLWNEKAAAENESTLIETADRAWHELTGE